MSERFDDDDHDSPSDDRPAEPRPRRWWLALILNLLAAPSGYAYLGAWRLAWIAVAAIILAPLAAMAVTAAYPPGVYLAGKNGLAILAAAVAAALAGHAAWLARRAPARTGPSKALLYFVPWLGLGIVGIALRAYGPLATYAVAGDSMAPGLRAADIVLTDQPRGVCGEAPVRQGDVVLYRRGADLYPARAVAGPGQSVWMTDGVLSVDGRPVARRLVGSEPAPGLTMRAALLQESLPGGPTWRVHDLETGGGLDAIAPTTVPARTWYLLGDNRDNAIDSRTLGPVSQADICAVATRILYAKDPDRVGLKP